MRKIFGIIVVVLAVVALACQPQERPSKVWLHRANDVAKAKYYQQEFAGLEVDVHYVNSYKTFIIEHDSDEGSDKKLEDWFASLDRRKKLGFWIDFKNLNDGNKDAAAKELARLRKTYDLQGMIIVESSNAECLKTFEDLNFRTSYYIPFFGQDASQEEKQAVTDSIRRIINDYGINTISGFWSQYPLMRDSFPEMRKLFWYERTYDQDVRNHYINLANEDEKTDVILIAVKEK